MPVCPQCQRHFPVVSTTAPSVNRVSVTAIDMPFVSIVVLMIKWLLATIPAWIAFRLVWWLLERTLADLLALLGIAALP